MAGIYIHIPFCKKLCFYCDFYHVISPEDNSAFVEALVKEASLRKDYLENEISLNNIFWRRNSFCFFSEGTGYNS